LRGSLGSGDRRDQAGTNTEEEAQVLNELKATGKKWERLVRFGRDRFEDKHVVF